MVHDLTISLSPCQNYPNFAKRSLIQGRAPAHVPARALMMSLPIFTLIHPSSHLVLTLLQQQHIQCPNIWKLCHMRKLNGRSVSMDFCLSLKMSLSTDQHGVRNKALQSLPFIPILVVIKYPKLWLLNVSIKFVANYVPRR